MREGGKGCDMCGGVNWVFGSGWGKEGKGQWGRGCRVVSYIWRITVLESLFDSNPGLLILSNWYIHGHSGPYHLFLIFIWAFYMGLLKV